MSENRPSDGHIREGTDSASIQEAKLLETVSVHRSIDHCSGKNALNSSHNREARHKDLKPTYASAIRNDRWTCPICLDLLTNPAETPCCHNLFCLSCLTGVAKCPLCKRTLGVCLVNLPMKRLVDELSLPCRHPNCGAMVKRIDLPSHEANCQYALVQCKHSSSCGLIARKLYERHLRTCPNQPCSCPLACGVTVPKSHLDTHLSQFCPNTVIQCPLDCGVALLRGVLDSHKKDECQNGITKCKNLSSKGELCPVACLRKELDEHHLVCNYRKISCVNSGCKRKVTYICLPDHDLVCGYKPIPCPNECQEMILRKDFAKHRTETCELEVVNCPFFSCGCEQLMVRKELQTHISDFQTQHWMLTAQRMEQLTHEMETERAEIDSMRSAQRSKVKQIINYLRA